jgi:hypothetical protein
MCSAQKVGAVSSSGRAAALPVYPELQRVYPEPRRVHSDLRRARTCSLSDSRSKRPSVSPVGALHVEDPPWRTAPAAAPASNQPHSRNLSPRAFDDRFSQFLTGTGLQTESDVTHSKQTRDTFLTGTRTAPRELRQGTPSCPELRSAAVPPLACPNKETGTQFRYSFRADRRGFRVNPEGIHPECIREGRASAFAIDRAATNVDFSPFLTGSGLQTENDVTRSKQTTEKFLTGARMHFRPSRSEPHTNKDCADKAACTPWRAQSATRSVDLVRAPLEKSTLLRCLFRADRRGFLVNPEGIHPECIREGRASGCALTGAEKESSVQLWMRREMNGMLWKGNAEGANGAAFDFTTN